MVRLLQTSNDTKYTMAQRGPNTKPPQTMVAKIKKRINNSGTTASEWRASEAKNMNEKFTKIPLPYIEPSKHKRTRFE